MHRPTLILLTLTVMAGCSDQRLVDLANDNTARQAEQNHEMAKLNQSVAEGTQRLVEADAQARQELLKAEESLDQQRHELDGERKKLAQEHRTDPIIANSISAAAILIACILPLAVAIYVLRNLGPQTTDDGLAELLMQEMASERSVLLPQLIEKSATAFDPPATEATGGKSNGINIPLS